MSVCTVIAEVARPAVLAETGRDSTCVRMTAIACDVLSAMGYRAEPLTVAVFVSNAKFHELFLALGDWPTPDVSRRWEAEHGAYCIQIAESKDPTRIGGHLATLIDGQFLFDGSIDQVSRPDKGIDLCSILAPCPDILTTGEFRLLSQGCYLVYIAGTTNRYVSSPDWFDKSRRESVVQACLAQLKGRV